jgi:hypothetical protein
MSMNLRIDKGGVEVKNFGIVTEGPQSIVLRLMSRRDRTWEDIRTKMAAGGSDAGRERQWRCVKLERVRTLSFLTFGLLVLSGCPGRYPDLKTPASTYLETPASTRPKWNPPVTCPTKGPRGLPQARVCINRCAMIVGPLGGCTVDPCDATDTVGNRTGDTEGVCQKPLHCFPDGGHPGLGHCVAGLGLAEPCDPAAPLEQGRCAQGLTCVPGTCPNAGPPSPGFFGRCLMAVREGNLCDRSCLFCEPGTSCGPGLSGDAAVCRRLCTTVNECALPTDRCVPTELATGHASICVPCAQNMETLPAGAACCPGTEPDGAGICRTITCGGEGERCCSTGAACNAGFSCQDMRCQTCQIWAGVCGSSSSPPGAECCFPHVCQETWDENDPSRRIMSCCTGHTTRGECCRYGLDDEGNCRRMPVGAGSSPSAF